MCHVHEGMRVCMYQTVYVYAHLFVCAYLFVCACVHMRMIVCVYAFAYVELRTTIHCESVEGT